MRTKNTKGNDEFGFTELIDRRWKPTASEDNDTGARELDPS